MNSTIVAAGHPFTVVTEEWPFDDDERACVELIARDLRQLANADCVAIDHAWHALTEGMGSTTIESIVQRGRIVASGGFVDPRAAAVRVLAG